MALRSRQPNHRAGLDAVDQMGRQEPLRSCFHGDRDQFSVALRNRRERVGPPMPAAIDPKPDPQILSGAVVPGKTPSRLDRHPRRVLSFFADVDHDPTQLPRGPQRIEQLEVVIGQQRRRGASHQTAQHIDLRGLCGFDVLRGSSTPSRQAPHLQLHRTAPLPQSGTWDFDFSEHVYTDYPIPRTPNIRSAGGPATALRNPEMQCGASMAWGTSWGT